MELLDWITLAVFFGLGFWAGDKWATAIHLHSFKLILSELNVKNSDLIRIGLKAGMDLGETDADGEPQLDQIDIKVEKHGEMLYAFRKDNDQFLGQGTSREKLIEAMADRMKNVRLIVVEGNEFMKSEA